MTLLRRAAGLLLGGALALVLAGCGGSAESDSAEAACPAPAVVDAAASGAAGHGGVAPPAAAGVPRPGDKRDDREPDRVTPDQAALVEQLQAAEQSPTDAEPPSARASRRGARLLTVLATPAAGPGVPADEHAAAEPDSAGGPVDAAERAAPSDDTTAPGGGEQVSEPLCAPAGDVGHAAEPVDAGQTEEPAAGH